MKFELQPHHRNIPDGELLNDLKKVSLELEKGNLTSREYDKSTSRKYTSGTILVRFAGWNNALEKAGLSVNAYKSISDDDLLNDLKKVALDFGKESLTYREYDSSVKRKYASGTIHVRFGGWNKALERAGFIVGNYKNIDREVLFENIEQVWLKLGRQPTVRDMKEPNSKFTGSAYSRNFGSWQKALEQFVEFINLEDIPNPKVETKSEEVKQEQTTEVITKIPSRHKTSRNINWRLRFLVMRRDNFKCNACGKSPTNNPGTELHIDHVLAWDKGRETVYENLQTLCSVCNIGKSNLDFTE